MSARENSRNAWDEKKFLLLYRLCKRMLGAATQTQRRTLEKQAAAGYVRLIETGVAGRELAPRLAEFGYVPRVPRSG